MVQPIKTLLTGGAPLKLRDFKEHISNAFMGQSMVLSAIARIQNKQIRMGLFLRCVSLQAKVAASLNAALVAEGCPEDMIIKAAEVGEEAARLALNAAAKAIMEAKTDEAERGIISQVMAISHEVPDAPATGGSDGNG